MVGRVSGEAKPVTGAKYLQVFLGAYGATEPNTKYTLYIRNGKARIETYVVLPIVVPPHSFIRRDTGAGLWTCRFEIWPLKVSRTSADKHLLPRHVWIVHTLSS
jgi:hypothetical protein